jgi:hypothetical protein
MKFSTSDIVNFAINKDSVNLDKAFNFVMQNKVEDIINTRTQEIAREFGTQEEK